MFKSVEEIQAARASELIAFYNAHSGKPPIKKFTVRSMAESRVIYLWKTMHAEQPAVVTVQDSAIPVQAVEWELVGPVAPNMHARSNEIIGRMLAAEKAAPAAENVSGKVAAQEEAPKPATPSSDPVAKLAAHAIGPGLSVCPSCGSTELYEGEVGKKGFVINEDVVGGCHHCDFAWDLRKTARKGTAGNAAGVAASWKRPEVALARQTRHAVSVTFDGKTTEHNSTPAAFTAYRLPLTKCIRFRMALKASGKEVFSHDGKMYSFALIVKESSK